MSIDSNRTIHCEHRCASLPTPDGALPQTVRLGVVCGEATLGGHEIRAVDDATSEHGALVR